VGTENPSVLIACPTYSGKEYAFQRWIDCVRQFPCEVLVVDNSPDETFYNKWRSEIRMIHLDLGSEHPNRRIAISMETIRKYFLATENQWWWSLESDILVPSYTLGFMLDLAQGFDIATLPYPSRKTGEMLEHSFGCTLMSRHLLERENFTDEPPNADPNVTTDAWFFQRTKSYKIKVIRSSIIPDHLKG
jgi:hypothetical protein